jgi:hypothetical protein
MELSNQPIVAPWLMFNLNDKMVEQMVVKQLQAPTFEEWNTTTLKHLIGVALGVNGLELRKRALDLLLCFVDWEETQPEEYFNKLPKAALVKMPRPAEVKKWIQRVQGFNNKNWDQDYIETYFSNIYSQIFWDEIISGDEEAEETSTRMKVKSCIIL